MLQTLRAFFRELFREETLYPPYTQPTPARTGPPGDLDWVRNIPARESGHAGGANSLWYSPSTRTHWGNEWLYYSCTFNHFRNSEYANVLEVNFGASPTGGEGRNFLTHPHRT